MTADEFEALFRRNDTAGHEPPEEAPKPRVKWDRIVVILACLLPMAACATTFFGRQ